MRKSGRTRGILAGIVLMAVVASPGCGILEPENDARQRWLENNRARWRGLGYDAYAFTLQRLCFCAGGTAPAEVIVRNGERVSVTVLTSGDPVPAEFAKFYLTVEELFDFILDAIDRRASIIEVSYDPEMGYPTSISIDYDLRTIDEEMSFRASSLRPLR